jgi:hypothetical protein
MTCNFIRNAHDGIAESFRAALRTADSRVDTLRNLNTRSRHQLDREVKKNQILLKEIDELKEKLRRQELDQQEARRSLRDQVLLPFARFLNIPVSMPAAMRRERDNAARAAASQTPGLAEAAARRSARASRPPTPEVCPEFPLPPLNQEEDDQAYIDTSDEESPLVVDLDDGEETQFSV